MEVSFTDNKMEGEVPNDIGRLTQMMTLQLSGVFPPSIYNLSSLVFLNIYGCGFLVSLRPDFGNFLPNLEQIYMGGNVFTGTIPATLSNISNLQVLRMEDNSLRGSIPPSFGKVPNLQSLTFLGNYLGSRSFGDFDFLGALTNCTQLQHLDLGANRFGGHLPTSIANLSANLIYLSLQNNLISGSIPHDIGNLISLQTLLLATNLLTGPLPNSLGKLLELGEIYLNSNKISGEIQFSIGNITRLETLYLYNKSFEGTIPPSLGNCSHLLDLRIGYNKLNGIIPREIMVIRSLTTLSMSHHFLSSSLPKDVGRLQNLVRLYVSDNKLSEELPQTLGNCLSMEFMYIQENSFEESWWVSKKLICQIIICLHPLVKVNDDVRKKFLSTLKNYRTREFVIDGHVVPKSFFKDMHTPQHPVHQEHIDAMLSLLARRFGDALVQGRAAILDSWFGINLCELYPRFKKFKTKSEWAWNSKIRDYVRGIVPGRFMRQAWFSDVDDLYAPFHMSGGHWVALVIHLKEGTIDVLDPNEFAKWINSLRVA